MWFLSVYLTAKSGKVEKAGGLKKVNKNGVFVHSEYCTKNKVKCCEPLS
jgi:hypothetical protein